LLLSALGTLGSSAGLDKTGGWIGAVAGLLSWYWATAQLTNSGWGRAVLPLK
jgi:succinate-acetate transporter protein